MIIKSISIIFLKIKNYNSIYPRPTFYNNGIVFLKLICDENYEGLGEVSPYAGSPKNIIKNCENIYKRYFKYKKVDLNYVFNLKENSSSNIFQSLLPSFDQAIYDLYAKRKKNSVAGILNSNPLKYVKSYASGGMIFENQSYAKLLDEAQYAKERGFFGYKFRPKMPINNLSHFQRIKNPPQVDVKELEKFSHNLKKKIGDNFKIMVDLGCRLKKSKEIKYLFAMFKEHNYFFVEEPFKRKPSEYEKQKKFFLGVNVAGGEHLHSLKEFKKWTKNKILSFYQPDTNLLLYKEINQMIKHVGTNKIILHNWCSKINFLSNINFAYSLKKNILIEKNMFKNPFDNFFMHKSLKIKKGKIVYPKTHGFGLSLKKKIDNKYIVYEKKI